jgi:hypothetical protein
MTADEPATEAVPPTTQAAEELAWSQATDELDAPHREWRRYLTTAALVGLVITIAAVVVWFSTTAYRQSNGSDATSQPKTTVQVSKSGTPTTTTTPSLTPQEQNRKFWDSLIANGIPVSTRDAAEYSADAAHEACTYLTAHTFDQTVDHVERTTIYNDAPTARKFLYAATNYFCPQ